MLPSGGRFAPPSSCGSSIQRGATWHLHRRCCILWSSTARGAPGATPLLPFDLEGYCRNVLRGCSLNLGFWCMYVAGIGMIGDEI